MSPQEAAPWCELRKRPGGYKFRRQFPLQPFSLDFACLESRLAIEVDGAAHDMGDRPQRDAKRDDHVRARGFATLRIPAAEVSRNLEGVFAGILEECRARGPLHRPAAPAGPPPRSGEELS